MTLPSGVTTATITVGKPFSTSGLEGTLKVTVTPDFGGPKHIIWAATGDTYENWPEDYPSGDGDPAVSFTVPHVDQAGWTDPAGDPIIGWHYAVNVTATYPGNTQKKNTYTRRISPLVGTVTADLDTLIDAPAADPVLGAIPGALFPRVVNHGSDASVARPSGALVVIWAGSVEPTHMDPDYDLWVGPF